MPMPVSGLPEPSKLRGEELAEDFSEAFFSSENMSFFRCQCSKFENDEVLSGNGNGQHREYVFLRSELTVAARRKAFQAQPGRVVRSSIIAHSETIRVKSSGIVSITNLLPMRRVLN
ncbi:MAG: hypothetical protein ACR2PF_10020 [Rhizobiaceae bacterium]